MNVQTQKKNSILKIILWPFKSYIRILLVVLPIGLYQYQSIQIDILARDILSLELKRNQLVNQNATLHVQIDQLTHINRIEKLASEKFDLISTGQKMEKLVIKSYIPEQDKQMDEQKKKIKFAGVK